jgi:hypothetical protein
MPLDFTGDSCSTLTGTEFGARGSKAGEFVAVNVSHDVFQDYGEKHVKRKASEKYDSGQTVGPLVTLRRRDFL